MHTNMNYGNSYEEQPFKPNIRERSDFSVIENQESHMCFEKICKILCDSDALSPCTDMPICDLKPGDVLFHKRRRPNFIHRCISRTTKSPYTHVSIYLGGGKLAESTVRILFPWNGSIRKIKVSRALKKCACIGVHRLLPGFWTSQRRIDGLNQFIDKLIAKRVRYDFCGVWNLPARRHEFLGNYLEVIKQNFDKKWDKDEYMRKSYFCSALVVACHAEVGIIGHSARSFFCTDVYSPADLICEPTFGLFEGYLVPIGGTKPDCEPEFDKPY